MADYKEKVRIIPNGLPIIGRNALHPKMYIKGEPIKMYYLSNLIWSKGYFDVLEAVNLLVNKYKINVECVFAGAFMSSSDDEHLKISNKADFDRYIRKNNLKEVVKYYPGMYGEEKDAMFLHSHLFLLPTYYINEGQPVSIIEAMSYGCVPIVTKFRHIPMMVNNENGIYVEKKNPENIAKAIMELMDSLDKYKSKSDRCVCDFIEKFSFDKFISQVILCMNDVINKDI